MISFGVVGFVPFPCKAQTGSVVFNDSDTELMTISNNYYKVGLSKSAGAIKFIIDKSSGDTLTTGSRDNAIWQVSFKYKNHWGHPDMNYYQRCMFDYSWNNSTSTLNLNFSPQKTDTSLTVTIVLTASDKNYFDLKMIMKNNTEPVVKTVWFPNHLQMHLDKTSEALLPISYPGTLLEGGFFEKHTNFLDSYPGMFLADYTAFKIANSRMAIYTLRDGLPVRFTYTGITPFFNEAWHKLEKNHFLFVHQYPVYTEKNSVWESPVTRFSFSKSYVETLLDYRKENKIDRFPSLQTKFGDRFMKFARTPWLYRIFEHGRSNFNLLSSQIAEFPRPSLLLLSGSNVGGFDQGQFPDVKPDPNLGTKDEFIKMLNNCRSNDVSVMLFTLLPVLNEYSETYQNILSIGSREDVVGVREDGELKKSTDGQGKKSYVITPQSPNMQKEFDRIFKSIFETYGCDMIYEDGVGVSGGPYDFNKYALSPLNNKQGWLDHTRRYDNYIQIVEGGYDRMAETCEGFMGSTYGTNFDTEDRYGNGVWSHFPALTLLFHDKVQPFHFWHIKTHSKHALSWNLIFGCKLHTDVDFLREGDNLREKPWAIIVFDFQRHVQSRITGKALTSFSKLTNAVIQSVYEDITVIYNRDTTVSYVYGNHSISPDGNLVTSNSGDLIAGVFTKFNNRQLTNGDHFLIIENKTDTIYVRQPMGNDTDLNIKMLNSWSKNDSIWVVAFDEDNNLLETFYPVKGDGIITFKHAETVQGQHVAYYKIFKSLTRPVSVWKYFFNDFWRNKIIMGNRNYEIAFKRPTCNFIYLLNKISGDTVYFRDESPVWQAEYPHAPEYNNFLNSGKIDNNNDLIHSYTWSGESNVLTWNYRSNYDTSRHINVKMKIDISNSDYFDMQINLENRWNYPIETFSFPNDLMFNIGDDDNVILPLSYPGIKIKSGFFDSGKYFAPVYPGLLKADFISFNYANSNISVYSVNKSADPNPVKIGFHHPGFSNSDVTFQHRFLVDIKDDSSWTSPVVRFRIGQQFEHAIKKCREENKIDSFMDLSLKLEKGSENLPQAPLFNVNFVGAMEVYNKVASALSVLKNPSLIILDNFTKGGTGYNQYHPDYSPKDEFGTTNEFKTMIRDVQKQGKFVMPFTIPCWWNENSPTMRNLTGSPGINDITYKDQEGKKMNPFSAPGFLVSPFHPFVKKRLSEMVTNLKSELGFDMLYEYLHNEGDAVLDFNVSAPSHRSYKNGWFKHTELYKDSGLIVDGGYDRLSENVIGFTGTLFPAVGQESYWDMIFGSKNWEPYPVAPFLYHDKAMQYPDFEAYVKTKDALSWYLLYGCNLSFYLNHWSGYSGIGNPWVRVVSEFQKYVASKTNGKQLKKFTETSGKTARCTFNDITVIRNNDVTIPVSVDRHTLPPKGVLVTSENNDLTAGIFTRFNNEDLTAGDHYLIVNNYQDSISVRQSMGADTPLLIDKPAAWTNSSWINVYAIGRNLKHLVSRSVDASGIRFYWQGIVSKDTILYYKIKYSPITSVELQKDHSTSDLNLFEIYPNPFNLETTIKYGLSANRRVKVMIYNAIGQKVITLVDKDLLTGIHQAVWKGTTETGARVPSGVYFCRFESGHTCSVKKIIVK